jgi:hypothetical protein
MGRPLLVFVLYAGSVLAAAQQTGAPVSGPRLQAVSPDKPLPPIRELLLDVERNQRRAEAAQKDYIYHVHSEEQEFDSKGRTKKTIVRDSESLTIDGIRINRVVARDGKPLTPEELKKEDDRIDASVAKAKAARTERLAKGQPTDARGDQVITASRILELGNFTNPRRIDLNGRPTIVLDYAGDPDAKTHSSFEGVIRDLVGTAWIDEHEHFLVQAQGHFLNDFKIGGGLVADIHKGSNFEIHFTRVNGEVWLPALIDGQGKARILLVTGFNGHIHLVTTDYRKFRASATIVSGGQIVDPDNPTNPPATGTSPLLQRP